MSTTVTSNSVHANNIDKKMMSQKDPSEGLSLSMGFADHELLYTNTSSAVGASEHDNSSLDSMENKLYQSERQTSIEKLVNDVLIPPLSESNVGDNQSANDPANLQSVSPALVSDIDLSNISPLSSLQQHPVGANHPYFSTLDSKTKLDSNKPTEKESDAKMEKMKPINVSTGNNKPRVHYSNTPNILTSDYGHGQTILMPQVKDDLYYVQYNKLAQQQQQPQQQPQRYLQHGFAPPHRHSLHAHSLTPSHQRSQAGKKRYLHAQTPTTSNTAQTSPLTPHSVRTAHTTLQSPQSVHSSHTPHTPQSMNHAFPRFTPYSTQKTPNTNTTTTSTSSNTNSAVSPTSVHERECENDDEIDVPMELEQAPQETIVVVQPEAEQEQEQGDQVKEAEQDLEAQATNKTRMQMPMQMQMQMQSDEQLEKPLTTTFSAPRMNYEEDGLSASDVQEVLAQLDIRPDTLRDSSTDFRPVFSCIRPIVCHKSNTPFYAQCSTAKLGYCTWCRQLRRGNQKQGSICLNCGERLTAKYHRWYPHLVRLEPLEKTRTKSMYIRYKPVFERFGITWHNQKQFDFVIDHYMIMKIYLSTENFNIEPLHLERTYMIGVFAGREFNTGALARKLLREGSKLAMFRADFPDYYDFLRDERAAVAEQMNLRFFQGIYKCYFHAHYTNIEGWYDPSVISRESIIETFKELCNTILAHTALAHINENKNKNKSKKNKGVGAGATAVATVNKKRHHSQHHAHNKNHHRGHTGHTGHSNHPRNNHHSHKNHKKNSRALTALNNTHLNMMNMNMNGVNMSVGPMHSVITLTAPNGQQQTATTANSTVQQQQHQQAVQAASQQATQQQPQQPQHMLIPNFPATATAATHLLNGNVMLPPPNMISNPLAQLSVTNMPAMTPIAKVKTFSFANPTSTPSYLPPLATTPRFTVPTPRGTPATYATLGLNGINASPLQMHPGAPSNGSNPPSVSMLAASNLLKVGKMNALATQGSASASASATSNNSNKKPGQVQAQSGQAQQSQPQSVNKKEVHVASDKGQQEMDKASHNQPKPLLNAGAAPFLLNTTGVISPPISPRNMAARNHMVPPAPPQSFAFPAPPLPNSTNWLPVPPVLTPTNATANNASVGMPAMSMTGMGVNVNPAVNNLQMNVGTVNAIGVGVNGAANVSKDLLNHRQNANANQNSMNMSLVHHHNRGSPLFTPTQSPQFRPFSH